MILNSEELKNFREKINSYINDFHFPEEFEYMDFLDKSINSLENESESYRQKNLKNFPGGLLDFSDYQKPVIVVPDIHARAEFLTDLLDFNLKNHLGKEISVLEALNQNEIKIICVGDGVHSESRGLERWKNAWQDYQNGLYDGKSMREEMKENISTMMIVMSLKNIFTSDFHFLKGNHENVLNENFDGNFSFRKFVMEGEMCFKFFQEVYGDAVLHLISVWEKSLPVFALFKNFCISHAEPLEVYNRKQIVNCFQNPNVIEGLTWTPNDAVKKNTCWETFKNLNPNAEKRNFFYLGGHRPVKEKYNLRQNGTYIQFHNTNQENIAFCIPGKNLNLESDIFSVEEIL